MKYFIKTNTKQEFLDIIQSIPILSQYNGESRWAISEEVTLTGTDENGEAYDYTELMTINLKDFSGSVRKTIIVDKGLPTERIEFIPTEYDKYGLPVKFEMEPGFVCNIISTLPLDIPSSICSTPLLPQFDW